MRLAEVKDFLKAFHLFENYYIGSLDSKKRNSLGVYNLKRDNARHKAFGGNEKYGVKGIALLIHGDTNKSHTEELAFKLYDRLDNLDDIRIGGKKIYFIELLQDEPVDVDKDGNAVYEYVIEMNIYYERQE